MNQKGFTPVLVLVVVALFGIGAYILIPKPGGIEYIKKQLTWPRPTPTPTPPPGCSYQEVQCVKAPCDPVLVCPTPSPAVDETANWKTYTNSELGFSLKLPSSIRIIEENSSLVILRSIDYQEDDLQCEGGCTNPVINGWQLRIDIQPNNGVYNKEVFKNPFPAAILEEKEEIKNGIAMFVTERARIDLPRKGNTDYIADFTDEKQYRITLNYSTPNFNNPQKDVFEQILSTFKFLE